MNGLMDLLIEALFGSADADARAVSTDEPLRILGACPRVPPARPDRIFLCQRRYTLVPARSLLVLHECRMDRAERVRV